MLRGELLDGGRNCQVESRRDRNGSAHEPVHLAHGWARVLRPEKHGDDAAALGDDHTLQLVVGEAVEDVQALGLELEGANGLGDGHRPCLRMDHTQTRMDAKAGGEGRGTSSETGAPQEATKMTSDPTR